MWQFEQRARGLNECRDLADVDRRVAMRARRAIIHFGDHGLCATHRGHGAVDRGAQAHESVRIGRRHLHQHDVERQSSGFKERFDFAQEDRRVIGAARGHGLAYVFAEKEAAMAEVALVFGLCVFSFAEGLHVNEFDIDELRRAGNQCIDQRLRGAAARLNPNAISGAHRLLLPAPRSCTCFGTPLASSQSFVSRARFT